MTETAKISLRTQDWADQWECVNPWWNAEYSNPDYPIFFMDIQTLLDNPPPSVPLVRRKKSTLNAPDGKTYVGYELKDILKLAALPLDLPAESYEVVFAGTDGWQDSVPLTQALGPGGLLAIGEDAPEKWSPLPGSKHATPGPAFFTDGPQPDQIWRIAIVPRAVFFAPAMPAAADPGTVDGFEKFKRHCMPCHAIEGIGGTKALPLVHQGNTTIDRFDSTELAERILHSEDYWFYSTMRPYMAQDLDREDIMNILKYIKAKADEQ